MMGYAVALLFGAVSTAILAWRRKRDRPAGRALGEASRDLALSFRPGGLLRPSRAAGRHRGRPVSVVAGAAGTVVRVAWAGAPARGETLLEAASPPPPRWPPLGLDSGFETGVGIRGGIGAARLVLSTEVREAVEEIGRCVGDFRLEVSAPRWSGWGAATLRVPSAAAADVGLLLDALGRIAAALEANPAFR